MQLKDYKKWALVDGEERLTYAGLIDRINSFGAALPIEKGEHVLLFSENRIEWIVALFAIWHKGGVAIPVDAASSPEEIAYFIADSDAKAAVVSRGCRPVLEEAFAKSRTIESIALETEETATPKTDAPEKAEPEETALILYTSGTTGDPKGVMLSYKNLYSNIESIEAKEILTPNDTLLSLLPFHHAYPLMTTILVPLHLGATVVLQNSLAGKDILETMQKEKVTVLVGVPRLYGLFHRALTDKLNANIATRTLFKIIKGLKSKRIASLVFRSLHKRFGGHIRYFISGGAKLDATIQEDFTDLGFTVLEGYGLSETSPIVSFNAPGAIRLGSVGRPIRSTKLTIDRGELLIRGDNLMQGYYNKAEKTAEAIREGWFQTGDLARIDQDGYLYITGRKKDMIVLPSGKNINPESVEKELYQTSPYIREVAVMQKGTGLMALILPDREQLHADEQFNLNESIKWKVVDAYNRRVVPHKRILDYRIIDTELPKTRLGKIKRFKLDSLLAAKRKHKDETVPDDAAYRTLVTFLGSLTKETIYPSSHLEIDLGIDSLGKVELQGFMESAFGIESDDKELARFESVDDLYRFIREEKSKLETVQMEWDHFLSTDKRFELYRGSAIFKLFLALIRPLFKHYLRLEARGLEYLPKGPCILVVNHQSYLDAFGLASVMPNRLLEKSYALGHIEFFNSFVSRNLGRWAHVVTVDYNKELKEAMQKSAYILKSGYNLIIFPEGARSRNGEMQEFKKFFAILATSLDIPVVPVTIDGMFDTLPIGSRLPKPNQVTITFSPPVFPEEYDTDELISVVKEAIGRPMTRRHPFIDP